MAEWTPEEIFAFYANDREVGPDRVHWQRSIPFPGRPGHFYFLSRRPRPPSHRDLARITAHSGHPEVVLMRINSTYVVSIGNRGVANATVRIPPRLDGIDSFTLLAHTHPLEMENKYEGVARGPTNADFTMIGILSNRWDQTDSTVVVCRGGHVERVVSYRPEPDEAGRRPDGRLWTPSSD